jgi:hypothetical protein
LKHAPRHADHSVIFPISTPNSTACRLAFQWASRMSSGLSGQCACQVLVDTRGRATPAASKRVQTAGPASACRQTSTPDVADQHDEPSGRMQATLQPCDHFGNEFLARFVGAWTLTSAIRKPSVFLVTLVADVRFPPRIGKGKIDLLQTFCRRTKLNGTLS